MSTQKLFGKVCGRLGFIGKALRLGQPTEPLKNGLNRHSQAIHAAICTEVCLDPASHTWKRLLRCINRQRAAKSTLLDAHTEFVT